MEIKSIDDTSQFDDFPKSDILQSVPNTTEPGYKSTDSDFLNYIQEVWRVGSAWLYPHLHEGKEIVSEIYCDHSNEYLGSCTPGLLDTGLQTLKICWEWLCSLLTGNSAGLDFLRLLQEQVNSASWHFLKNYIFIIF